MKNINRYKAILFLLAILVSLGSCNDFFDVNVDPNNPEDAAPRLILPAAQAEMAVLMNVSWNICGSMWAQHWTQGNTANQYTAYDSYNLNNLNFAREWREAYAGALSDLYVMKQKAEAAEDWNHYLISEVLSVYTWQYLVDMYGNIPYSEALQGTPEGGHHPNWEEGNVIYADLINRLDAAMAKDFERAEELLTLVDPEDQDLMFGGDMASWFAFANSLKLKIYMRQVYANNGILSNVTTLINDPNVSFIGNVTVSQFSDNQDKRNPLYENDQEQLNTAQNIRASQTIVDYLQANNDPRDAALFGTVSGNVIGQEQGGHIYTTTYLPPNTTSQPNFDPVAPVYILANFETSFFLAEYYARINDPINAQAYYDIAVSNAFDMLGENASSFIGTGGVYEFPVAGTIEEQIEAIMMQKWVALCNINGLESYIEIKRTGYPVKSDVLITDASYIPGQLTRPLESVLTGWQYPSRFLYPNSYIDRNQNAHPQAAITDRVWWDTEAN